MNHYFEKPDKLQLFDNSETPRLILEADKGQVIFRQANLPSWVTENFDHYLQNNSNQEKAFNKMNIDEVRNAYKELLKKRSGG